MPRRSKPNSALYADERLTEGVDYARRHRELSSGTVVLAPHGGGIEAGTSELCLAIAGVHPGSGEPMADPGYDYWMFEGLRTGSNVDLHITSTRCDDPVALALCAAADRALAVHGCQPEQAGLSPGAGAVLVGGLDEALRRRLLAEFRAVGVDAFDANGNPALGGRSPSNIVNRTGTGSGAQLELTTPLRQAMFGETTRPRRGHTTTALFWDFVAAARTALRRE